MFMLWIKSIYIEDTNQLWCLKLPFGCLITVLSIMLQGIRGVYIVLVFCGIGLTLV